MTIYEGWELPEVSTCPEMFKGVNVGKLPRCTMPSDKAKTVKLGMKFNGPYQYMDTSTGEMRQTMPTLSRDDIRLQAGLLRHGKRNQLAKKSVWATLKGFM